MKDKIVNWIYNLLNTLGIDPLAFSSIICILISIYYIHTFLKYDWNKISTMYKFRAFLAFIGTIIIVLATLLIHINKVK